MSSRRQQLESDRHILRSDAVEPPDSQGRTSEPTAPIACARCHDVAVPSLGALCRECHDYLGQGSREDS